MEAAAAKAPPRSNNERIRARLQMIYSHVISCLFMTHNVLCAVATMEDSHTHTHTPATSKNVRAANPSRCAVLSLSHSRRRLCGVVVCDGVFSCNIIFNLKRVHISAGEEAFAKAADLRRALFNPFIIKFRTAFRRRAHAHVPYVSTNTRTHTSARQHWFYSSAPAFPICSRMHAIVHPLAHTRAHSRTHTHIPQ